MPKNPKVAVFAVRMAPPRRDGLREAAAAAGCSMNAYVVQVLAAAAGHRARFRGTAETGPAPDEQRDELRELARDHRGFPRTWSERQRHLGARQLWVEHTTKQHGFDVIMPLVHHCDAECPWFYVEWRELNGPEWPEGREPEGHRGAA